MYLRGEFSSTRYLGDDDFDGITYDLRRRRIERRVAEFAIGAGVAKAFRPVGVRAGAMAGRAAGIASRRVGGAMKVASTTARRLIGRKGRKLLKAVGTRIRKVGAAIATSKPFKAVAGATQGIRKAIGGQASKAFRAVGRSGLGRGFRRGFAKMSAYPVYSLPYRGELSEFAFGMRPRRPARRKGLLRRVGGAIKAPFKVAATIGGAKMAMRGARMVGAAVGMGRSKRKKFAAGYDSAEFRRSGRKRKSRKSDSPPSRSTRRKAAIAATALGLASLPVIHRLSKKMGGRRAAKSTRVNQNYDLLPPSTRPPLNLR